MRCVKDAENIVQNDNYFFKTLISDMFLVAEWM